MKISNWTWSMPYMSLFSSGSSMPTMFHCSRTDVRSSVKSVSTHIAEVDDTQLSQSIYNLSADFVGDIQLGQRHLRRTEESIFAVRHDCVWRA